MGVDAGEDGIEGEVHVLLVYYMLACRFVSVAAAATEIDDEDEGGLLPESHQEVVRLDVSVEIPVVMQYLEPVQDLQGDDDRCFQAEGSSTKLQQLLETRSEKRHDQIVIVAFVSILIDLCEADFVGVGIFDKFENCDLVGDLGFFD